MASESCLNNLHLSSDQRERLFDQICETMDGPTREQIMLQLFTMTQESAQLQFMLDISRSMSKAYADLVSNFISTLTNLVLIRPDAYLHHAHPSLDALRLRNLHAVPISGGDLFERSFMQEYEQHLMGLGVKPGSKKEQRFYPYKETTRAGVNVHRLHKGYTISPCHLHNIWCSSLSFNLHPKVIAVEGVAVTEGVAAEAAQVVASSSNLFNDTQYHKTVD